MFDSVFLKTPDAFAVCCYIVDKNDDVKNLEEFLKDLEKCAKNKNLCQMNKGKAEINVDAFMKLVEKHNINIDETNIKKLKQHNLSH